MRVIILIVFCIVALSGFGQSRKWINSGNKEYKSGGFDRAITFYDKVINKDSTNYKARYNRANALYRSEGYLVAQKEYADIKKLASEPEDKSRLYHNLGNSYLNQALKLYKADTSSKEAQDLFKKSIESYKTVLRVDPDNNDSRYNLMYARKFLRNNDQQKDKDKQDQEEKDKQDNDDQKDKGDQKGDDNKDKGNNQQKDEEQKGENGSGQNGDADKGELKKQVPKDKKEAERNYKAALENARKNYMKYYNNKSKEKNTENNDIDW